MTPSPGSSPSPRPTAPQPTPEPAPQSASRPSPPRIIPRATYRLQLHRDFDLRAATLALPYLAGLGVSHVYCSPILMARPGSSHGYDVVDPTRLNPDLGTTADFGHFCRALVAHGLGLILDIVPNHMGVDSEANSWWQDVLRLGPASAYADWFDIDWAAGNDRLLLPILGAALDEVIAAGDIAIDDDDEPPRLRCYERRLPINAAGLAHLQAHLEAPSQASSQASSQAPSQTPSQTPSQARQHDADADRATLSDPALVRAIADLQHYELADWREAATRINYRRFFDVSMLAAIRVELPRVFGATHAQVLAWVRAGLVDGLRIDHPDGLRDPGAYFQRLQQAASDERGRLYVVAEKILAPGEDLPSDWPIDGTTGYDFANLVCGVLVDDTSLPAMDTIWRDYTGETTATFAELSRRTRHEVLETAFAGELTTLGRRLLAALGRGTPAQATTALAELIACFPVYRTYPGSDHAAADRRVIEAAVAAAARHLDEQGQSTLDAIGRLLSVGLGSDPNDDPGDAPRAHPDGEPGSAPAGHPGGDPAGDPAGKAARDEFVIRFQQLLSPVVAKGVEDTALYRWSRLVSLNDVGGDPDHYGVDVAGFHAANRKRAATWPHALLATSTHDNKRGEYVRLRINAISEDPAQWQALVARWSAALDRELNAAGMLVRPTRSDLYLLFQTLVGSAPADPALLAADWRWPTPAAEAVADYAARIKAYMLKAGREAKSRTSWLEPNDDYEVAVARAIDLLFSSPDLAREWLADIRPFAWWGGLNSLTATVLKLTAPGVPDIYQGARVLDDSLVDPDNRRPVDFDQRLPVIEELARLARDDGTAIRHSVAGWLAEGDFARLKLWLIQRLLQWRAGHAALFDAGGYEAVPVTGRLARHVIAFIRRHGDEALLVVTTRLYRRAGFTPAGHDRAAAPPLPWTDETLDLAGLAVAPLPASGHGPTTPRWRDLLLDPEPLDPEPLNPEPLNPKPLDSEPRGPEPLNPEPIGLASTDQAGAAPSRLSVGEILAALPVAVLPLRSAGAVASPPPSTSSPSSRTGPD